MVRGQDDLIEGREAEHIVFNKQIGLSSLSMIDNKGMRKKATSTGGMFFGGCTHGSLILVVV